MPKPNRQHILETIFVDDTTNITLLTFLREDGKKQYLKLRKSEAEDIVFVNALLNRLRDEQEEMIPAVAKKDKQGNVTKTDHPLKQMIGKDITSST